MIRKCVWPILAFFSVSCPTFAFAEDAEVIYRRVQLTPGAHRYSIQVAYRHQTTLLFPSDCHDVELGDSELFEAELDQKRKRRISVSAKTDDPRADTNMTVHCTDLNVIISISVPATGQSKGQLIDFSYSEEDDDRVVSAVKKEREFQENRLLKKIAEIEKIHTAALVKHTKKIIKQQRLQRLEGAVNHLHWWDTRRSKRHDDIVVHIRQRIAIGAEKMIILEIRNRSGKTLDVSEIAIIKSSDATRAQDVLYRPARIRLGDDERIRMGVSFIDEAKTTEYKILIRSNSSRWVEVTKISI